MNLLVISQLNDSIIHKITSELNSHKINLFIEKFVDANFTNSDKIYQTIIRKIPTVSVDINATNDTEKSVLRNQIYYYQQSPAIHVIIINQRDAFLQKMIKVLEKLVDFSPLPPRPKCLIIIPGENSPSKNDCFKLLEYAWHLKFLELVILKQTQKNAWTVFDFNPFTRTYIEDNFLILIIGHCSLTNFKI